MNNHGFTRPVPKQLAPEGALEILSDKSARIAMPNEYIISMFHPQPSPSTSRQQPKRNAVVIRRKAIPPAQALTRILPPATPTNTQPKQTHADSLLH